MLTNDSPVKQDMKPKQYPRVNRSQGLAYDKKESMYPSFVVVLFIKCVLGSVRRVLHKKQCKLEMAYHRGCETN